MCDELSAECGEVVCRVWGDCLESVVRLSEGCGETVWRLL